MPVIDQRTSGFLLVAVLLSMIIVKLIFTGNEENNVKRDPGPILAHLINNFMLVFCGIFISITQILRLPAKTFLGTIPLPRFVGISGVVLLLASLLLYYYSLAAMKKNFQFAGTTPREGDVLVTVGPYRLIRHPLYLAGFLFVAGMALFFGSLYLLVLLIPYTFTLAWLITFEEENLERAYGQVFEEYRCHTGRILPRLPGSSRVKTEMLAEVYLLSMKDDPMYRHMFPEFSGQLKHLFRFWKALIGYAQANGKLLTDQAFKGAACWLPPGKTSFTFIRLVKSKFGIPVSLLLFPAEARTGAMKIFSCLEKVQKELLCVPHWYLMAIGVHPDAQNHGIGKSLIKPVLLQADEAGLPCYLETETEKNVGYYRTLGFETCKEFTVPGTELKYFAMIRNPVKKD